MKDALADKDTAFLLFAHTPLSEQQVRLEISYSKKKKKKKKKNKKKNKKKPNKKQTNKKTHNTYVIH